MITIIKNVEEGSTTRYFYVDVEATMGNGPSVTVSVTVAETYDPITGLFDYETEIVDLPESGVKEEDLELIVLAAEDAVRNKEGGTMETMETYKHVGAKTPVLSGNRCQT